MTGLQTQPRPTHPGSEYSRTGFGSYATLAGNPPSRLAAAITDIRIGEARDSLILTFETGDSRVLPAGFLWQECRSAAGIMRRLSGEATTPPAGLTILRLAPVGDYAINIVFSDGHHRGIFPWGFLQELAAHCRVSIQE